MGVKEGVGNVLKHVFLVGMNSFEMFMGVLIGATVSTLVAEFSGQNLQIALALMFILTTLAAVPLYIGNRMREVIKEDQRADMESDIESMNRDIAAIREVLEVNQREAKEESKEQDTDSS